MTKGLYYGRIVGQPNLALHQNSSIVKVVTRKHRASGQRLKQSPALFGPLADF